MSKFETIPNDKSRLKTVSVLLRAVFDYLDFDIGACLGFRMLFPARVKCGYTSASAINSAMCFGWRFVRSVI